MEGGKEEARGWWEGGREQGEGGEGREREGGNDGREGREGGSEGAREQGWKR